MTDLRPDREPPYVEMRVVAFRLWFHRRADNAMMSVNRASSRHTAEIVAEYVAQSANLPQTVAPVYDWQALVSPAALDRFREREER
jgi:hypothetical protein